MGGSSSQTVGFRYSLGMHLALCHGPVDAIREIIPTDRKLYSWWSYRSRDWSASDRGRRLDHIWLSPALAPYLRDATITREARGWDQPSDHVPVTIDLDLPQQDD